MMMERIELGVVDELGTLILRQSVARDWTKIDHMIV
jgi:hypothetical protein